MGPSTGLFDVGGQRLVTPPIRGRADELKLIGALVTAVAQGRGGVLVIEGPPGIGKSRLLTEVLALADKSGVRTLFGEAFEYQQTVPFFSLFMATLNADPPVGDAEALRKLGGSADLRYWVVHDLADAIHAAAAQTPLVIVLEDIHWADNGTLLALRSLATARPDVAVLWVLTARTGAGGPAVQETLSVLQRANATFVRLAAMTPDAVADMVQDAVRAKADVSLLNLAAKAHGNPFLVSELLGGLSEEERLTVNGGRAVATGYALPRRLGVGMQQRLDLLSDSASEVVRVAAVLPDRFSAGQLAAMLDRAAGIVDVSAGGGGARGPDRRRRRAAEVSARLATRGHPAVATAVTAAGDGAPVGVGHARDGCGPSRSGHPVGTQRRARRPGGDRCAAPSRPIGWPRRCECGRGLEQARVGAIAHPRP